MQLREWQYINKQAGNVVSNSSVFKGRLKKLAGYAYRYKNSKVTSVDILKLTDNEIKFAELFESGATAEFEIFIKPTTEDWNLKIYTNNSYEGRKQILDASGTSWVELLKELRYYITIPTIGTPDYKDLLTESLLNEWTLMSPPALQASSASSGYKKKFEKLIKYHIDHASSELESITRKDISNWYFRLGEHYNNGHHEFDREILVIYDKDSNTFYLSIIIDGKQVYHNNYKSYEEILETLTGSYMYLPDEGTQEYDDLLVEWVSMKNNSSSSTSSAKTNKEKFKKILDYHIANVEPTVTKVSIKELTDDGFYYIEHRQTAISEYDFGIEVKVDKNTDSWSLQLYRNGNFIVQRQGDGWENLLKEFRGRLKLPLKGTPEYDDLLTESASPIADDFKLYENLWD